MGGDVGPIGSAAIVGLTTHVTSSNPSSPFYGTSGSGITLNPLVLAVQNTASGLVEVEYGQGGSGFNAAFLNNGNLFQGLAVDTMGVVIPSGDTFTVTSTLSVYGDPAMLTSFDPTLNPSLLAQTGPLPSFVLANAGPLVVPEPSAMVLGSISALTAVGYACCRRCRSRRALPPGR
jgi:hypothetical protein